MVDENNSEAEIQNTPQPPAEASGPAQDQSPEEVEISDEGLDQLLNEADPSFANSLGDIGSDLSESDANIESLDLDAALEDGERVIASAQGWRKWLYKALPFLPTLSIRLKFYKARAIFFFNGLIERLSQGVLYLVTDGRKLFTAWLITNIKNLLAAIKNTISAFFRMSFLKKLSVLGIILLIFGTASFVYFAMTKDLLNADRSIFMRSYAETGSAIYDYEPTEKEEFYDSLRNPQNILQIEKILVNLKRSSRSSNSPMGIFEFYINASTAETLVEVKDREVEMRDHMHRTLEEFSYDQASSNAGKTQITDQIKRSLNQHLSSGRIRKVMIKSIILKP